MTIADALKFLGLVPNSVWVLVLFLFLSFVEVSKIKINPWSALFNAIGKRLNHSTNVRLDALEKSNAKLQTDLSNHVVQSQRRIILDFADNLRIGQQRHSKEQFDYVILICKDYEWYIEENKMSNGQVEEATEYIRNIYQERLRKNDFL